jgi:hypothetical protein
MNLQPAASAAYSWLLPTCPATRSGPLMVVQNARDLHSTSQHAQAQDHDSILCKHHGITASQVMLVGMPGPCAWYPHSSEDGRSWSCHDA